MRNKEADTREKVSTIVTKLKAGIHNDTVTAAYVERINEVPVLFVHAGYRRSMVQYTLSHYNKPPATADGIASSLNALLKSSTHDCKDNSQACSLSDMAFQAGPDRGGSGVGGPFWTDFKVFVEEAESSSGGFDTLVKDDPDIMQVVGHTAKPSNIRYTKNMRSICIDAGMVYGTSSFLEISTTGKFYIHIVNNNAGQWVQHDLTAVYCNDEKTSD